MLNDMGETMVYLVVNEMAGLDRLIRSSELHYVGVDDALKYGVGIGRQRVDCGDRVDSERSSRLSDFLMRGRVNLYWRNL